MENEILILFLFLFSSSGIHLRYYPARPDDVYTPSENSGDPLFLTPYIESGQILAGYSCTLIQMIPFITP